ncbi:MAG: hypothetical protein MJ168_05370 [Clostridia bacterium]|nr:hypothetical protein [Clostridia bacterium]
MNDIIIAVIAFAGTLVGTFGGILAANKLSNYRIEQLEKKVEKHNNLVERMYHVEDAVKSAHHRLDEIREELTLSHEKNKS